MRLLMDKDRQQGAGKTDSQAQGPECVDPYSISQGRRIECE